MVDTIKNAVLHYFTLRSTDRPAGLVKLKLW